MGNGDSKNKRAGQREVEVERNAYAEEYAYLRAVLKTIEDRIPALLSRLGGRTAELIKARREMYDEGRHIILTFEDAAELSGLNEAVDRSGKSYLDGKKEYERLALLSRSAYFGRFDFRESGGENYESFYIGRASLAGEKGYLVYDWRAPVSSIYYEYGTGPVSYEGPYETFYGDVNLKRQYKISGDKIEYMFDTEAAVHDELLAEILAENAGSSLKPIISSIQREQNDAIRNNYCKYLLICGLRAAARPASACIGWPTSSTGIRKPYAPKTYWCCRQTIYSERTFQISCRSLAKTTFI
jgi:DNA helicase-2/ATP-dependent DNA helicase PcrA